MKPERVRLLEELAEFGQHNDSLHQQRALRMLNITPDTGEFLQVLVHATQARQILEIGTSNGYSTIWLADAVEPLAGKVTTLEYAADKVEMAATNFAKAGVQDWIQQVQGDAGVYLQQAESGSVDLLFLDSERSQYLAWWPDLKRVLAAGATLVVDNATSHAAEMQSFIELVKGDSDFVCCTVPVGNGEFLATRRR